MGKSSTGKTAKAGSRGGGASTESRRELRDKGRRAPVFERGTNSASAGRDDDYAYESDRPAAARGTGAADEAYTPDDLAPGQVGEVRPARSESRRGRRSVSAKTQDSETETITPETGAETGRSAKGGFDEGESSRRGSEIASEQRREGPDRADKQDYGRAKTSDGKPNE
jgi:hypothetical protein